MNRRRPPGVPDRPKVGPVVVSDGYRWGGRYRAGRGLAAGGGPATVFGIEVDAVVVGAGPAGAVATAGLVERGLSVCLVEAGPGGPPPAAVTSLDTLAATAAPGWTWLDRCAPAGGGYVTGRGLGGGAAVNGMVLTAGATADYEGWAVRTGDDRWRWSTLAPALTWIEERLPTVELEPGPLAAAVIRAATDDGVDAPTDGGSLGIDHVGVRPATIARPAPGRRPLLASLLGIDPSPGGRSIADGGVASRSWPDGLTVCADTAVRRVRLVDGRAQGVELADGSTVTTDRVVLCAGAVRSPGLVGTAVPESGAPSRRRWPVVDHPSFTFTVGLRPDARLGPEPRPPVSVVIRDVVDGVATLVHVLDHTGAGSGRTHGALVVALARVRSVGTLIAGADGGYEIDPGWLRHDADAHDLATAVRAVSRWLDHPAVAAVAERVSLDDRGTGVDALADWSTDQLVDWLRHHPGPVRHPCASLSPLDPERPAPVPGLVEADGAALPWVPEANPQLPIMLAARAVTADL